jgi:hypothetical protein
MRHRAVEKSTHKPSTWVHDSAADVNPRIDRIGPSRTGRVHNAFRLVFTQFAELSGGWRTVACSANLNAGVEKRAFRRECSDPRRVPNPARPSRCRRVYTCSSHAHSQLAPQATFRWPPSEMPSRTGRTVTESAVAVPGWRSDKSRRGARRRSAKARSSKCRIQSCNR